MSMNTHPASLSCRNVTLSIGGRTLLDHASLELPLAGLTILRGQNGAGKTCFLRALLGLLPLQGGQILINGEPPARARHHCGYMPQRADDTAPMIPVLSHVMACLPASPPDLPPKPAPNPTSPPLPGHNPDKRSNPDHPRALHSRPDHSPSGHSLPDRHRPHWPRLRQSFFHGLFSLWPRPGRARRAAEALLAETGALSLARKPLGALSGGERQRVALAQALANSPSLLILDEPFAALDEQGHAALLQLFGRLHGEKGINLLITAHGPLETDSLPMTVREVTLAGGTLHV